jgi:predicted Rossmann-fold nucleotide-binding protein
MEAANRGAHDVDAPSIGYNITLPMEQEPNAFSTPDLTFRFHYFAMRKMHFAMRANALVVFPGGVGNTEQQLQAMAELRADAYAGTPSFLRILLEKAAEAGLALPHLKKALLSGEAFPVALRDWLADPLFITCMQKPSGPEAAPAAEP